MRRSSSIGGDGYDIGVHGCTTIMRVAALATCAAALMALAGCPGDSTVPTLASATSRYDTGQYDLALSESEALVARGPAADRAQAELIAGMAAFQLDRFEQAERHFIAAERSGAPAIRGRARVMLANVRLEQGRISDAAALFDSGAADLAGADADKARRYAQLARDGHIGSGQPRAPAIAEVPPTVPERNAASVKAAVPGKTAAPVKPVARASTTEAPKASPAPAATTSATPPAPRARTASTSDTEAAVTASSGTFTVRAGAYTTEAAARRRMKALAADVRRAKSPDPHIAAVRTKDGDTLYAVRIGTFRSRADAEALLKRLARKDLAVGAL